MGIRDQIRQGDSRDLLDAFAAAGDPAATLAQLGPDNPSRARCELQFIVADGPSAKGRAAAIINPRLVDDDGSPYGLVGFFECDGNLDTARWLFDYASEWLAQRGCKVVRGPINLTTWHDYRLVSKTQVDLVIPGEPVHPDYYPALWRDAGFEPVATYSSNWLGNLGEIYERFTPSIRAASEHGYALRPIEPQDLPALHQLAMRGFAGAFMYSPIELDEFVALYTPARAAAAAANTRLAVSADGEPLGFLHSFDTEHDGVPVGVVKTVVVSSTARGKGLYKTLLGDFCKTRIDAGIERGIGALMHVGGDPQKMGWCTPESLLKEYELYERAL